MVSLDEAARRRSLEYLVRKGLRAQLTTGSLITGQKLITLNLFPDAGPAQVDWDGPYPVFPTVPTQIERVVDFRTVERDGRDVIAHVVERVHEDRWCEHRCLSPRHPRKKQGSRTRSHPPLTPTG